MLSTSSIYRTGELNSLLELHETSTFDITPIFEVSKNAPKILSELVIVLDKYKEAKQSEYKSLNKEVSVILSKFTKSKIVFKMNNNIGTACIYPEYKFSSTTAPIKSVEILESLTHIKKATILVDYDLFFKKLKLTSSELIGVILHEVGHLTYHTSFFPGLFKHLFRFGLDAALRIAGLARLLRLIPLDLTLTIWATSLLCSRTLSIFEHMEEYDCDKYAIKYGYGDELISAFIKLNEYTSGKFTTKRGIFSKLFNYTKSILNITSHPTDVNRICKMSKLVQQDYTDDYPFLKKQLTNKLKTIDC